MRFTQAETRNMYWDLNEDEVKMAILEYVINHSRSGAAKDALTTNKWGIMDVYINYDEDDYFSAQVGRAVPLVKKNEK